MFFRWKFWSFSIKIKLCCVEANNTEMNFLIVWTPNYIQFVPLTFLYAARNHGVLSTLTQPDREVNSFLLSRNVKCDVVRLPPHGISPLSSKRDMITQPQITQLTFIKTKLPSLDRTHSFLFDSITNVQKAARDFEERKCRRSIDAGRGGSPWRVLPTSPQHAARLLVTNFQIWQILYLSFSSFSSFFVFDTILFAHIESFFAGCFRLAHSWLRLVGMTWIDNRAFRQKSQA